MVRENDGCFGCRHRAVKVRALECLAIVVDKSRSKKQRKKTKNESKRRRKQKELNIKVFWFFSIE